MNGRVVALADHRGTPRLLSAVVSFFSDKQLSAKTRRAYRQCRHSCPAAVTTNGSTTIRWLC